MEQEKVKLKLHLESPFVKNLLFFFSLIRVIVNKVVC